MIQAAGGKTIRLRKKGSGLKQTSGTKKTRRIQTKFPEHQILCGAPDARAAALIVLNELQKKSWTLDAALEVFLDRFSFPSREQGLFHAIIYGVLRWKGAMDPVIEHFSHRLLERIEPEVLNILRIALFQIRYLDRVPVSAAVDTAVELTRRTGRPWAAGFVNALLRAAAEIPREALLPDREADPVGWLAQSRSFPAWLVSRWVKRWGHFRAGALCDAQNEIPPITVRANRLKVSRDRLLEALKEECEKAWPCRYAPDAVSFFNPKSALRDMNAFQKGWFQVQDEAAQLVTILLDPQPGEMVLDACAGLGGKTGHIAQQMENRGRLFSWDIDARRLTRLLSEMQRLGVAIVTSKKRDLESPAGVNIPMRFDRVLLDAPCSGLGVLRRNPDGRWRVTEEDLSRHRQRQLKMLSDASTLVKPSGVLVYAVCSTEPEENDDVVEAFLTNHADFLLCPDKRILPHPIRHLMEKETCLKTNPLDHGMDGFFAVRLEKRQ